MNKSPFGNQSSLTRKTIVGTAWLLLWRVVTRALGFVSTLVLARLLLASDFGLVAMATSFSLSIEAISQLGLQEALVRRREEGLDLHHTAFTMQVARALITGLIIAASAPAAGWWFADPRLVTVVLVLAGLTVMNGLENVGIVEYRRGMQFEMQFRLMSIPRLVGFVATIGCAMAWRSYWALLAGMLLGAAARVAMSYWLHPFRPRLALARWRELAGFSFWTWATAAASLVWDRCDPFVLGPAFGATKLGLYLLAMQMAVMPITELVAPAAEVLFAAFSRAQKDGDSSLHHAPEVAGMVLLGVAPVALSISAASGPFIEILLGPKWVEAWPIVAVLSWACVFSPYSYICSMALVANGYVRRNFVGNVVASAIKLAALLGTVSLTYDLIVIGAVSAACVAVESVAFLTLLAGTGSITLRSTMGGLARVIFAIGFVAAIVHWSGLGWRPGSGSTTDDLTRIFLTGGMSTALFGLAVLLLWQVAGRPDGAEKRLLRLALTGLQHSRVSRSVGR
jgi:lipopolysaccharide exporter